jgi:hypothetical protein
MERTESRDRGQLVATKWHVFHERYVLCAVDRACADVRYRGKTVQRTEFERCDGRLSGSRRGRLGLIQFEIETEFGNHSWEKFREPTCGFTLLGEAPVTRISHNVGD